MKKATIVPVGMVMLRIMNVTALPPSASRRHTAICGQTHKTVGGSWVSAKRISRRQISLSVERHPVRLEKSFQASVPVTRRSHSTSDRIQTSTQIDSFSVVRRLADRLEADT